MAEHDTDSIQAIVNLYPRFDGKDKTHFLEYKDKLRVSLSFHWQRVAAILEGEPKPITAQRRRLWRRGRARTRTFSASCSS